jgi:hypothetical protein
MGRVLLSLAVTLVLGFSVPPATAGEEPQEGDCDETGRLVCAGAEAGGSVNCVWPTTTSVSCDWAHGILWSGFSPLLLPGDVEGSSLGQVEVCLDQSCSADGAPRLLAPCSWVPASQCVGSATSTGSIGPIELVMGQCLKVTASESLEVTARVINEGLTLASVTFANSGEGADQECLVDDGRG